MTVSDPEILWHYTDAAGAFSIIKSGRLWFGDVRFLNDATERENSARLVTETLEATRVRVPDPYDLQTKARRFWSQNNLLSRLYTCSFSEVKDSLSQWERYGANGHGYCLGFRTRELDSHVRSAWKEIGRLRMVYNRNAVRTTMRHVLADGIVRNTADLLVRHSTHDSAAAATSAALLASSLELRSLAYKNKKFADEREWRYVVRIVQAYGAAEDWRILLTQRGTYFKPYLEVPKVQSEMEQPMTLPLATIVYGPKLDQPLAHLCTDHLLSMNQYRGVTVEPSELFGIWR